MNNINSLLNRPEFFIPFLIWSIFWKGSALWKSANKKQLVWFVILLTINTLGLLEIAYIFFLNRWDIDNGKILNYLEKKLKRVKK
jgi:methionyl-tRNA synthetase